MPEGMQFPGPPQSSGHIPYAAPKPENQIKQTTANPSDTPPKTLLDKVTAETYPTGPNFDTAFGPSGPYAEQGPWSRTDSDS